MKMIIRYLANQYHYIIWKIRKIFALEFSKIWATVPLNPVKYIMGAFFFN